MSGYRKGGYKVFPTGFKGLLDRFKSKGYINFDYDLFHAYVSRFLKQDYGDDGVDTSDLQVVRTGNNLMVSVNNKYIVRIRKYSSERETKEKTKPILIERQNSDHLNEGDLVQKLHKSFQEDNTSSNPIPELVHLGDFNGNIISIYKKNKGICLDVPLVDAVKVAKDLSNILSLIHGITVTEKSVDENRVHNLYRLWETKKRVLDKYPYRHKKVESMMESFKSSRHHGFDGIETSKELLLHGDFSPRHVLIDGNQITAIVDWEHTFYDINGFQDLQRFYLRNINSNYKLTRLRDNTRSLLPSKYSDIKKKIESNRDEIQEYYNLSMVFWDIFSKNYICPIKNDFLSKDEIRYIEFFGFITNYCEGTIDFYQGNDVFQEFSMDLLLENFDSRYKVDTWNPS